MATMLCQRQRSPINKQVDYIPIKYITACSFLVTSEVSFDKKFVFSNIAATASLDNFDPSRSLAFQNCYIVFS